MRGAVRATGLAPGAASAAEAIRHGRPGQPGQGRIWIRKVGGCRRRIWLDPAEDRRPRLPHRLTLAGLGPADLTRYGQSWLLGRQRLEPPRVVRSYHPDVASPQTCPARTPLRQTGDYGGESEQGAGVQGPWGVGGGPRRPPMGALSLAAIKTVEEAGQQ